MRTEELSERPVGELVQQLSQQTATLVREEMRLAQAGLGKPHLLAYERRGLLGELLDQLAHRPLGELFRSHSSPSIAVISIAVPRREPR